MLDKAESDWFHQRGLIVENIDEWMKFRLIGKCEKDWR